MGGFFHTMERSIVHRGDYLVQKFRHNRGQPVHLADFVDTQTAGPSAPMV